MMNKKNGDSLESVIARLTAEEIIYNNQIWKHTVYHSNDCETYFGEYDCLPSGNIVNPVVDNFWQNCWQPLMCHLKDLLDKM